ncbi:hypothetical protein MATL_G00016930 [Megalops atlanticus]|uniref:NERD domain-containing protein n=1 Tax=Megalops atlanticus TaxID=7932 RepID=A0A9D3QIB3_MEGAT|nr:hypothetical protein MATL_G00016930 [Megalops atlanticus]
MFQLGSRLVQFQLASDPSECRTRDESSQQLSHSLNDVVEKIRNIGGLRKDDIFCNLRIPNQFQTARDEINLVVLTGRGVFCIDVKCWRGEVSAQSQNWQLRQKEEDQNFTNTSIQQVVDPLQAITTKTTNLWNHLKRNGVSIRQALLHPRVLFLSADCHLEEGLRKREELVSHGDLDAFLRSFREGYVAWISDALTPSWLSGHLSYRQLADVREVLKKMGTWDLVRLHCGEQLKGDYQGCQHIALNRQETDELEFSKVRTLSTESLWALLGHSPQVTVKMYKRGGHAWLGKPLSGTTTIPSNAHVVFRISGEDTDAKIPATRIRSISLSI